MQPPTDLRAPSVSVVVPVYNEEDRIGATLRSLLDQTYPKERYELVVVDNGSSDCTRSIVKRYDVRLLVEPKRSSYAARNRGIRETDGDFLAFIDSDCVADPAWLEKLMRVEREQEAGLVAGRIELLAPKQRTMGSEVVLARYSADRRRQHVEGNGTAAAGNLLVKRELFEKLGLFSEYVSGADTEFTKSAAEAGRRVVYAREAIVRHPSDISNWGLIRRTFRVHYGAGIRARQKETPPSRLLKAVPWRPPLRLPLELHTSLAGGLSPLRSIRWRAYLWVDNVAGWMGQLFGYIGVRYQGDRR